MRINCLTAGLSFLSCVLAMPAHSEPAQQLDIIPGAITILEGQAARLRTTGVFPATGTGELGKQTLAGGRAHSCAIFGSGTVRCWGFNGFGQLGNGTTNPSEIPVNVIGITSAVAIAAGFDHSCALLAGGSVYCWGRNVRGQIGDGSNTTALNPVQVVGISNAVGIEVGSNHGCAVLATGGIACWGENDVGQLGNGSTVNSSTPVAVAGISDAVQVAAGFQHTCAVQVAGTVRCWGGGANGELGNGSLANSSTPVAIPLFTAQWNAVDSISVGGNHSCAKFPDGSLYCWGLNQSGQLGIGSFASYSAVPVRAQIGLGSAGRFVAGGFHTCAITTFIPAAGNRVVCWGENSSRQLDNGLTGDVSLPVLRSDGRFATTLAAGFFHTCARSLANPAGDGAIDCWGLDTSGQLGRAGDLAAGDAHACAAVWGGRVFCWGENEYGQLGDGSTIAHPAPVPVTGIATATQIDAGPFHTCARLSSGLARCWGLGTSGQLGQGVASNSTVPVGPSGIGIVNQVAAGLNHSCARLSTGAVRCWGEGGAGQLGNGTRNDSLTPVQVTSLNNVVDLEAGDVFNCAVINDGTVRCWGTGPLGTGVSTSSLTPVTVGGISNAIEVAAGANHACAVLATGGVRCWGYNGEGALGDGTTNASAIPVAVSGITNAIEVAVGGGERDFSCALLADGGLRCWGSNVVGALGTAAITPAVFLTPQPVSGIHRAHRIEAGIGFWDSGLLAGGLHACALNAGGRLYCWGLADAGQLGIGETSSLFSSFPLLVDLLTGPTGALDLDWAELPGSTASATVSQSGNLRGFAPGEATFRATYRQPGIGDVFDDITVRILPDVDRDSLTDALDNCPLVANSDQADLDADRVGDACDNCTQVANGLLNTTAAGPSQNDADGDGYGNICDADLNNSGLVTTADFGILRSVLNLAAGSSATAAAADLNGSGTVTTADFSILRARLNTAPGPSGLNPP